MAKQGFRVELTTQAKRDIKRLGGTTRKGQAREALDKLLMLSNDPGQGESLAGNLYPARSLHFTLRGSGQFRAAYVVLEEERVCIVFMVGPRENFYREAERRYKAL